MAQDLIGRMLGGYEPQTRPQAAGFVTGAGLAGKQENISALRAAAIMERSAAQAEASVSAFDDLLGDPELVMSLVDRDPYFQKHQAGAKYLKALLMGVDFIPPSEMAPHERPAFYGGLEKDVAGVTPVGGFPPESELYAGLKGQLAPAYAGRYPTPEQAQVGVPPGAAGQGLEAWRGFTEPRWGWKGPTPTAEMAAGRRVGPGEVPEEPTQYMAWLKTMNAVDFNSLNEGDRMVATLLSGGGPALLAEYGPDVLGAKGPIGGSTQWAGLLTDKHASLKADMGATDWKTYDAKALKAKPFIEKFSMLLAIITGFNPGDNMIEWLVNDWLLGRAVLPYRAGGEWGAGMFK